MRKKNYEKLKQWFYIIIIFSIVILDILSKHWIIENIKMYETKKIFSILNIFHVHNYGAAFSFLSNQNGWQKWFLSIISILTILVLIRIIIKTEEKEIKKKIAYSFIISGAMGNLIDRILHGFVVDFIDMHIHDWHFATFNIADFSIFIGIIILIHINYSIKKFKQFI